MSLIKCNNCGHMVSDMANKCPKCGKPIMQSKPSLNSNNHLEKKKNNNKGMRTGLYFVLLLIIMIIAFTITAITERGFIWNKVFGTKEKTVLPLNDFYEEKDSVETSNYYSDSISSRDSSAEYSTENYYNESNNFRYDYYTGSLELAGIIGNNNNVVMNLYFNDSYIEGSYYYTKIGRNNEIKLDGNITDGHIRMTEYSDSIITGTFDGYYNDENKTFNGKFTNIRNKVIPFILKIK